MSEKLKDYSVVIDLSLLWGQMDAFQHVNNIIFFRFYESVRITYFEKVGFLETMEERGIGPILASTQCKYISPLTYPDTIHIGTRIGKLKDDRFTMEYCIVSQKHEQVAALGTAEVVSYDYNREQKADLPKEVVKQIKDLEEGFPI
ncbi:MAG: thioesterase family protein [Promethearchaeia archaeon]